MGRGITSTATGFISFKRKRTDVLSARPWSERIKEMWGLSAITGTHCVSLVCEVFYFSLVLAFFCFTSFVFGYSQEEPKCGLCVVDTAY